MIPERFFQIDFGEMSKRRTRWSDFTSAYEKGPCRLSPPDRPPEPRKIDHLIGINRGSTVAPEAQPSSLRAMKTRPTPPTNLQLETLTRKIGHLRVEVQHFRQCHASAQELCHTVADIAQRLQLAFHWKDVAYDEALESFSRSGEELKQAVNVHRTAEDSANGAWLSFFSSSQARQEWFI
ncbi:hypothetical protein LTS18_014875 [Coniosporium uncinatum]|uniref:Uncharacterized protein n=1 Tax=Coniosporium uncinatum TaxID=93489 RepID=A0ACC3DVA9_9PEZI|nr:hypothetical protein LTS18_014875 [Coniosporium uncinatum]